MRAVRTILRLMFTPNAWRALPRNLWPPSKLAKAISNARLFLDIHGNSKAIHSMGDGLEARNAAFLRSRSHSRRDLLLKVTAELDAFMASRQTLSFPCVTENPKTTIILVLHNKAPLTFACLRSIVSTVRSAVELVIVDNNSTDETRAMLKRVAGAKVILNDENNHYLLACNQAVAQANGEYLLFLNNDAQLLQGALDAALRVFQFNPRIGAVGGKIVLPNGALQEAGCIVWQDGNCLGYGRGDDPNAPAYNFRREVDFCSGAFLLTPCSMFREMGGFDEQFAPAYYEEVDYCLRLNELGRRVIYEPAASILHYEFGSSSTEQASSLMEQNRHLLVQKHSEALSRHWACKPQNVIHARTRCHTGPRVLYVDDRIPHVALGSGFPRANRIVWSCVNIGVPVTFFPTVATNESWEEVYHDLPRETEIILGGNASMLSEFLRQRAGYYDIILVSRPHNMERIRKLLEAAPKLLGSSRLVYDAEAIFALREFAAKRVKGLTVMPEMESEGVRAEIAFADIADAVIAVSEAEAGHFGAHGHKKVHVLRHMVVEAPTSRPFSERSGILFVGTLDDDSSPNVDSIIWFVKEVLPRIREQLAGERVPFVVVGSCKSGLVRQLSASDIALVGRVDDVTRYYDQARIFVAPTRFAAGVPLKVYEAAAHGTPVIVTRLLSGQLGWVNGQELLAADVGDPAEFASQCVRLYQDESMWNRTRMHALQRVGQECSPASFEAVLKQALLESSTNGGSLDAMHASASHE